MNAQNWKDGEIGYCKALIATKGNGQVGRSKGAVVSYLRVQAASATRTGDSEIARAFHEAAGILDSGNWDAALQRLAETYFVGEGR